MESRRKPSNTYKSLGRLRDADALFLVAGVLLVAYGEYSQSPAFYWSHTGNILSRRRSIGRTRGIFSVVGVLLVAHGEYSQSPAFYWSHTGNILTRRYVETRSEGLSWAAVPMQAAHAGVDAQPRLGLQAAVKPLLRRSTTGEFNSPANYLRTVLTARPPSPCYAALPLENSISPQLLFALAALRSDSREWPEQRWCGHPPRAP
eukprot:1176451-Prorocentrum_minimum.AAC.2